MIPTSKIHGDERALYQQMNTRVEYTKILLLSGISAMLMILSLQTVFRTHDTRSNAANSGPMLAILPSTVTISTGETASFAVSVASRLDSIAAVSLDIPYDTQVLDGVTFVPGQQFPVVLSAPTSNNGRFTITVGVSPGHPYSGTGVIGTLKVRGVKNARIPLGFGDGTAVASIGKTSNSVTSKTAATVVVTGAPGTQKYFAIASRQTEQAVSQNNVDALPASGDDIHGSSGASSGPSAIGSTDGKTEYSPYKANDDAKEIGIVPVILLFFQNIWKRLLSFF